MTSRLRIAAVLGQLTGGFLVWSSCFVALYGVLSLGCEAGWGNWLRPGLLAVWVLHLAVLCVLLAWQWRRRGQSDADEALPVLQGVALAATAAALLATVWIGWPVLALPPCAGGELRGALPLS